MVVITITLVAFLLTGISSGLLSCALYGLMKQFDDMECENQRVNVAWKIAQGG